MPDIPLNELRGVAQEGLDEMDQHIATRREFTSSPEYTPPPMDDLEEDGIVSTFFDRAEDVGRIALGLFPRNINRATKSLFEVGAALAQEYDEQAGIERPDGFDHLQRANNAWRRFVKVPEIGVQETEEGVPESPALKVVQDVSDYITRTIAGGAAVRGVGLAAKASAAVGIGIAGFTSDNEETSLIEAIVGALPDDDNTKAVKAVLDLDPDKPDDAVLRRGIKAIEDISLGIVGDKAVNAAADVIGPKAKEFLGEIPATVTSILLKSVSKTKNLFASEDVAIGNTVIRNVTKGDVEQAGFAIRLDPTKIREDVPIENQINRIVSVEVAGDGASVTQEQGVSIIKGIQENIVKNIEKELVSDKGPVSTIFQAEIRALARQKKIGPAKAKKIAEKNFKNRLKGAVEQEAANIYFSGTYGRFLSNIKASDRARQSGNHEMAGILMTRAKNRFSEVVNSAIPFYQSVSGASGLALQQASRLDKNARKLLESVNNLDVEDIRKGADTLLTGSADHVVSEEALKQFAKSFEMTELIGGSPEDIMRAMAQTLDGVGKGTTKKNAAWKAFESSYINGILSSPETHLLNHTSSELMAINLIAERGISSLVPGGPKFKEALILTNEWLRSHYDMVALAASGALAATRAAPSALGGAKQFKGRYDTLVTNQKRILENKAGVRGNIFETPGLTPKERNDLLSIDKFDEGLQPSEFSGKAFGVDGSLGATIDVLGKTVGSGWVRDVMSYSDNLVKVGMIRGEQRAFINAKVFDEDALGLSDIVGPLPKNINKQVEDIIATGGKEFDFESKFHNLGFTRQEATTLADKAEILRAQSASKAADTALTATFQKQLGPRLTEISKTIQDTIPAGRLFVPFIRTPVNIFNEQLKRMPVITPGEDASIGLPIHPQFYKDFAAGGKRRADALAKAAIGNALFMLGAKLVGDGVFLEQKPSGKSSERKFFADTGLQEVSFKGDEQTFSFMQYAPFAAMVAGGALMRSTIGDDYDEVLHGLNDDEFDAFQTKYMTLLSSQAIYLNDLPLLQGPQNLLSFVGAAERSADSFEGRAAEFLGKTASAAVPATGLLSWIGRQNDQYIRDMQDFNDYIKDRLPTWREDLPVGRDALWDKRELGETLYGPFKVNTKTIKNDLVRREMLEVGAFPDRPKRKIMLKLEGANIEIPLDKDEFNGLGEFFDLPQNNVSVHMAGIIGSREYKSLGGNPEMRREMLLNGYRDFTRTVINQYATITPTILEKYHKQDTVERIRSQRVGPASVSLGVISEKLREKEGQ